MDEHMHAALSAAAQHTPYGEVLLATKYELDLIHGQLAEILAEVKRLGGEQ
jgi:hypothetical protein